jgi:hypothetical protein
LEVLVLKTADALTILTLAVSLLLHALVASFLGSGSKWPGSGARGTVEFEVVEQRAPLTRPIVTDLKIEDLRRQVENLRRKLVDAQSEDTLLSRNRVRVDRQTVAPRTGPTVNRSGRAPPSSPPPARSRRAQGAVARPGGDLTVEKGQRLDVLALDPANLEGVSTLSEDIPNIETGSITSLNTDRIRYYTFFERLNGQLRNRWVPHIRRVSTRANPQALLELASRDRVTEIEVVLDSRGYLFETNVLKSSGVAALDLAAVSAFAETQPYLNPPLELIDPDDNMLRLYYSFRVEFRPRHLAGP